MRYIITLLLITFFSLKVFSQNAKVEGKVTDSRTNQPIAGASVVVDNSNGTTTGMDGNFSLLLSSG
ncbi:MAG: carboxypeptidase-like regulatory domain-containing protein, partial [Ginsengibacter sp.]